MCNVGFVSVDVTCGVVCVVWCVWCGVCCMNFNPDPPSRLLEHSRLNLTRPCLHQAEEKNPGVVHELIDAILESEQSKGGEDSVEKLLRVANRDIAGMVTAPSLSLSLA